MKHILMIAAEYPPCLSAGVQRTFHFAENLYKLGWQPVILSAHPRIYARLDDQTQVSPAIQPHVYRAFAADASRHFAIQGKYLDCLEDPDKFASWYHMGWRKGLKLIRTYSPEVIWSTFPVSTAHRIALKLKQKTGSKWVADFRDPLHSHCDDNYKNITPLAKRIDRETAEQADALVFATEQMKMLYQRAYSHLDPAKFVVIENGYDENVFDKLERTEPKDDVFTLLYSGGLYPHGRDPVPLFKAIAELVKQGELQQDKFRLHFRGSGDGSAYHDLLEELGISSMVHFLPSVSYKESIQEMKNADGLLVLQGKTFNNQIPGKVYEYIATGNPILGIVGQGGATEGLLKRMDNNACVTEEENVASIRRGVINMFTKSPNTAKDFSSFSRSRAANKLQVLLGL